MTTWKFILSQPYVGWIKMKTYSPTNFSSPSQPIGQNISHKYWKQINCVKLPFLRPIRYSFAWISNINSRIKCKISSKLKIEVSFWCLYCWLWIYLTHCSSVFSWLLVCKWQMEYFTALIWIYWCILEPNLGALWHLRQSFMKHQSTTISSHYLFLSQRTLS